MSVIAIVKSERGKDHVFLDGFTFRRAYYHSTVGGWKWRCTNKKCTANLYLDNELTMLPGSTCEHNHSALSRKRRYMKEMDQTDTTPTSAAPVSTVKAEGESLPVTNGDVSISKVSVKGEAVNGEAVNGHLQKPKRARRASSGVRRKRQKKLPPSEDIPEGTHHLAEDCVFPLDQCDSNTVFVNIFDNQAQQNQQVNRMSSSNPTSAEEQPENFDPLSETFRTTAFPAICDLSPKAETANGSSEVINLDDEDDGAEVNATPEEADNDCFLYEDVSLHRNVRLYPYHNVESYRNSSSRSLCVQNSRPRSTQNTIDLAHHIDTFFFAMAQSVKRLSTMNQIRAKQMITKIITKFEMDEAV